MFCHFYHWSAFQLGGSRGPGPLSYAYGLTITVQICSDINYKICHNQIAKEHLPQYKYKALTPKRIILSWKTKNINKNKLKWE